MQPTESSGRPALTTQQLARVLELRLVQPDLPEAEVLRLCAGARQSGLAAVSVPPSDLDAAARLMGDSPVVLGTVIDVIGTATPAVKQYAARDALRRGARLIEAALNRAKMHSRQFQYVESELQQLVEACREKGATLSLSLSPWRQNGEEMDILTARAARRAGVNALCTTALDHARKLLELSRDTYSVVLHCAAPGLEEVLEAHGAGCGRVAVAGADGILRQYAARIADPGSPIAAS